MQRTARGSLRFGDRAGWHWHAPFARYIAFDGALEHGVNGVEIASAQRRRKRLELTVEFVRGQAWLKAAPDTRMRRQRRHLVDQKLFIQLFTRTQARINDRNVAIVPETEDFAAAAPGPNGLVSNAQV